MRRGYSSSPRSVTDLRPPAAIPGRETSPRPGMADRLIEAIFCPACLCLRIHPTHLLVCPEHRRKVIHRARER